ncbi:MAG TPA: cytochrome c biogenesis protein CcsA [Longimicrobiaceae bacterium]|nr:cytochrome c biogenesis protein CcsA [Longimicrobiaceae bacterium]
MNQALHLVALALYLLAAVLLGVSLARGDRRLTGVATALTGVGVMGHLLGLVTYWAEWGELPLVGLGPSLSVLALLIGLGSLGVATLGRTGPLGLVLVPLAALLAGVALLVGVRPSGEVLDFRGPWFVLHVVLALVGYAGLTVAFACGLMYLVQFRELKNKHFGAIFRFFPPLDTLDRMGKWALIVGLPFLTLALAVGWAWTERFHRPLSPGNPKVVWGVLSWALILAALLARTGGGRRAFRAALASVLAFAVVFTAYVVLRVAEPATGGFL